MVEEGTAPVIISASSGLLAVSRLARPTAALPGIVTPKENVPFPVTNGVTFIETRCRSQSLPSS